MSSSISQRQLPGVVPLARKDSAASVPVSTSSSSSSSNSCSDPGLDVVTEQPPAGGPAALAPDSVHRRFSVPGGNAVIPAGLASGLESKMAPAAQIHSGAESTQIQPNAKPADVVIQNPDRYGKYGLAVSAPLHAIEQWMQPYMSNQALRAVADELTRLVQMNQGPTLVVQEPTHWIDRACLVKLELPPPLTIKYTQVQVDPSSRQREKAVDFVRRVSPGEADGIKKSVLSFYRETLRNIDFGEVSGKDGTPRPDGDNAKLAGLLVSQISEKSANTYDLLFEMAAQLHAMGNELKGRTEPLAFVMQRLPSAWQPLFSPETTHLEKWVDRRSLIGFVPTEIVIEQRARPVRVPIELAKVPYGLATSLNRFVSGFKLTGAQENADAARLIIKQITVAAKSLGQTELALTEAVGKELREVCERAKSPEALYCFASNLGGDSQALFLDVLMVSDQFRIAQSYVTKLNVGSMQMDDAQFLKFNQRYAGVASFITKLPYQTRMMVVNDLNKELERIAKVNERRGADIRRLKLTVEDLS